MAENYIKLISLIKRMEWFNNNRCDIARAYIRDDLLAIDNEVSFIKKHGLSIDSLERIETHIRNMERHKPEDSFLWD